MKKIFLMAMKIAKGLAMSTYHLTHTRDYKWCKVEDNASFGYRHIESLPRRKVCTIGNIKYKSDIPII